jgi:hypothetical protein
MTSHHATAGLRAPELLLIPVHCPHDGQTIVSFVCSTVEYTRLCPTSSAPSDRSASRYHHYMQDVLSYLQLNGNQFPTCIPLRSTLPSPRCLSFQTHHRTSLFHRLGQFPILGDNGHVQLCFLTCKVRTEFAALASDTYHFVGPPQWLACSEIRTPLICFLAFRREILDVLLEFRRDQAVEASLVLTSVIHSFPPFMFCLSPPLVHGLSRRHQDTTGQCSGDESSL